MKELMESDTARKQEEQPRPEVMEVTAPNGFKTLLTNTSSWTPMKSIFEFKTRPDDVFIVAYPKSGSTWMEEILWLVCNNANIKKANQESLPSRVKFINSAHGYKSANEMPSLDSNAVEKHRIMKCHQSYEILPEDLTGSKKGKIIYIARNPKDVCVSYYHFHLMNSRLPLPGPWDKFLADFCSGQVAFGSWFQHVLKFWEEYQKDKNQIHFVTYEALKKDSPREIAAIAKFLGKQLTEEQISQISHHCTFESMSENKQTNYDGVDGIVFDFKVSKFMRKGQAGDWKNYFTVQQNEAFNQMYAERMNGMGLHIPFEVR